MSDERLWLGVTRRRWQLVAYVFLAVMMTVSIGLVQRNSRDDREQSRRDAHQQCVQTNFTRQAVRDLVVFSYTQTGTALDLTAIPSFHALDPATQLYLTDLSHALASSASPEERQRRIAAALATVPLRECDKEFPLP